MHMAHKCLKNKCTQKKCCPCQGCKNNRQFPPNLSLTDFPDVVLLNIFSHLQYLPYIKTLQSTCRLLLELGAHSDPGTVHTATPFFTVQHPALPITDFFSRKTRSAADWTKADVQDRIFTSALRNMRRQMNMLYVTSKGVPYHKVQQPHMVRFKAEPLPFTVNIMSEGLCTGIMELREGSMVYAMLRMQDTVNCQGKVHVTFNWRFRDLSPKEFQKYQRDNVAPHRTAIVSMVLRFSGSDDSEILRFNCVGYGFIRPAISVLVLSVFIPDAPVPSTSHCHPETAREGPEPFIPPYDEIVKIPWQWHIHVKDDWVSFSKFSHAINDLRVVPSAKLPSFLGRFQREFNLLDAKPTLDWLDGWHNQFHNADWIWEDMVL
jgi:hypothetical protein